MNAPRPPTQAELWNTSSGQTWVELQAVLDRMLDQLSPPILEAAFPGEGKQVLDIGCGAGATTRAMARRLGPDGSALGVDVSAPLIAAAKATAAREGVANARFLTADAQTADLSAGAFDAVMSRFGVMFFEDPDAAFANLRRAARPGAKLAALAWRSPAENPLFSAPTKALARFLPQTPPPAQDVPGQFAFADRARVEGILARAGWRDVRLEALDLPQEIPVADLVQTQARMGPVGAALRDAPQAVRDEAGAEAMAALAPFIRDGVGHFTAACWLIRATA